MKTCNDCIHYDVCYKKPDHFDDLEVNGGCKDFADKSRFIELPCEKGDVLYRNGEKCIADHWNILLTAFNEKDQCRVFNAEEAEKALKESEKDNG